MDVSIVIPAHNEKRRLPPFLLELASEIRRSDISVEIIIVDDGSSEEHYDEYLSCINTIKIVPIQIIRHRKNRGKGAAIRTGFNNAKGMWIGFVDADGAVSPKEIMRVLEFALESKEVEGICASRIRMLGHKIERSLLRHMSGRIFATFVGIFLGIPIYDSQCGCKFFKAAEIAPYLEYCKETGYLLDIELIMICYCRKLNIIEFPVDWTDKAGGKVNLFRDGIGMTMRLFRNRARFRTML